MGRKFPLLVCVGGKEREEWEAAGHTSLSFSHMVFLEMLVEWETSKQKQFVQVLNNFLIGEKEYNHR